MSKRYVLLKDIISPDLIAKAGDIGIKKDSLHYDENNKVFFDNGRYFFYLRTILQYPDWFKEITDTPPNPTKNVIVGGIEYLSPRDVWEREKKAFEAARGKDYFSTPLQESVINGFVYATYKHKYPTFEDYKKANP